jgi:hypothetical protein
MSKIIKVFIVICVIAVSFSFNSCKKDSSLSQVDDFSLNIPLSINVKTEGSTNPLISLPTPYCLSQSSGYTSNASKIKKLTFVEAAWRTDSVKNITTGTVKVTVGIVGGATLFQKTLAGSNPADYISSPFILSLTDTEKQALNNYLNEAVASPQDHCLSATIQVNVGTGTPAYYLNGFIDMVVEATD